jgi:exopolyphosphatase/guanosine-5'-triphosphate,3'-diphosphate pyrophosphatase
VQVKTTKRAIIDIGTNTLLLLIVDDQMRAVVDLCRFGRLGKGLDASGRLSAEAIARSLEFCREYRRVMDEHRVSRVRVIATQAMREAANAADFVGPAEHILGATIEVIAGKREADLAFVSVARTISELAGQPYVVVDVGGGSTEFIATDGHAVTAAISVPVGAVRMHERHVKSDPPTAAELAAIAADVDAQLERDLGGRAYPRGVPLIGTAGTATTMAAIHLALRAYDADAVTGLRLAPAAVAAQLARVAGATVAERQAIAGIPPERADVIAAGIAIYARAMARLEAPVMIVCDRGIRWGLAYEDADADAGR